MASNGEDLPEKHERVGQTPAQASARQSTGVDLGANEEREPDELPPPAYSDEYGRISISRGGLQTEAYIEDDGRVGMSIGEDSSLVSQLLLPTLKKQLKQDEASPQQPLPPGYVPPSLGGVAGDGTPPPPMNIVIHVVGSRGDVQPFIALGKVLKDTYGHRVRLATHGVFKDFVTKSGLEFFCIGGDPAELMAFMVKNPGLMPGPEALRNGDVRSRRKGMEEIVHGCWRSCIEAGDGTGPAMSADAVPQMIDEQHRPFIADAIIANPPSFAHIHCAEKLGIPVHLMFTMPWSPTQAFPHPLANIHKASSDVSMTNFMSYVLVELMTWQGLGDVLNRFRVKYLNLEALSMIWGPGLAARLRIPYTYCWSPALIAKPNDWKQHLSVCGFFFLSLGSDYQPDEDLAAFLNAGPPPVYIGFGSIVVDDPNAMTNLIFEAVRISGQRALVSKGWGGFGGDDLQVPENVFMLGNVPHDWLFKHVSCVVHHGGAGTTSAGIALGTPTVIVPFFGDQPFWGAMVAKAGAGPDPIPSKELTAEKLAAAITSALQGTTKERAKELADSIAHEKGTDVGAKSFHDHLEVDSMRCTLAPSRVAVWQIKGTKVRLSALAAAVLGKEGKLDPKDLRLFRSKEYDIEDTPMEPIVGAAAALMGTATSLTMGVADVNVDIAKAFFQRSGTKKVEEDSVDASKKDGESEKSPAATPPIRQDSAASQQSSKPTLATASTQDSTSSNASKSTSGKDKKGKGATRAPPDFESAIDATRGVGRIVDAGLRSPMDFTMALAKGYRNVPKMYGDETVRPLDRVTGFQSGLKVAGKEFSFGLYDGITGLVTQPMEGAKKEGFAGLMKGFGKGIGGVVFKPSAAFWAIPGYTFQGIYKELRKRSGASVQNYIIAARTAQGLEDVTKASEAEQRDLIARWDALQPEMNRQRRAWYKEAFKAYDQSQASKSSATTLAQASTSSTSPANRATSDYRDSKSEKAPAVKLDDEYEEAVRQSIAATSKGDPEEDAVVEEAIRASLAEFQQRKQLESDDPEMARAMQASMAETQHGGHQKSDTAEVPQSDPTRDDAVVDSDDDENIKRAIAESQGAESQSHTGEDEELTKALEESRKAHEESERKAQAADEAVIEYMKKQSLNDNGGA